MSNDNEPARNQCDGCARGLPIHDGIHYIHGTVSPYMACTAHLYNEPAPQAGQIDNAASSQEDHAAGPADAGSPDLKWFHEDAEVAANVLDFMGGEDNNCCATELLPC